MRLTVIILGAFTGGFVGFGLNWAFWMAVAELSNAGPDALGYFYFAYKCSLPAFLLGVVLTAVVLAWKLPR